MAQTPQTWLSYSRRDDDVDTCVENMHSMVGEEPRRKARAHTFPWLRPILVLLQLSEGTFDILVGKMGLHAAAECVLLMLPRHLKTDDDWARARALGIPRAPEKWSGLARLQTAYNNGAASRSLHVPSPGPFTPSRPPLRKRPQRSFR